MSAPRLSLPPLTVLGHRRDGRPIFNVAGAEDPPTPPTPPASTPPAAPAAPTPPARPDGVSESEWSALGDPGKAALVRERERATTAERALAAARTPKPTPPATPPSEQQPQKPGETPDIAALIQAAVTKAIAPIHEAQAQREAAQAAQTIRDTVTTAATERFHDPSDALAQIDLPSLTDGNGAPDQAKITAALDDLLTRKPHLGKPVDDRRRAAPGSPVGAGAGGSTAPLDDRVKATLARMQSSTGVKFADA